MRILVISLSLVLLVWTQPAPLHVETEHGPVQGHIVSNVDNGEYVSDVHSFLAVPYGRSTEGEGRFRKPQKPIPWGPQPFVASTLGDACAQMEGGLMGMTHPNWTRYSEDCLHLNIYTPPTLDEGPHPVMVWFHGGAYTSGANIQYPGHFLATRGVIVVVVNYRINIFGFAYSGNDACQGNFGLWDQHLSLEFVRDNIANFGGDPNRVTIFGQSAGAGSTAMHLVSTHSKGLAHQAIMESGTEDSFWTINYPESNPVDYLHQAAEQLDCMGDDDFAMMDCMRDVDWRVYQDYTFNCTPGHFCQGFAPVVDGPDGFLPKKPVELRAEADLTDFPMITGITYDDGSLYTLFFVPRSVLRGFNQTEYHQLMRDKFWMFWAPSLDDETAEDMFQAWMYNYTPWPYVDDEYTNRHYMNRFLTDVAFGYSWDEQMKYYETKNPVYGYLYNYRGRNATQVFPEWMGVPHMGEIPQVFGYPLIPLNPTVREDQEMFFDLADWTDEDRLQTVYWETMYANFAKTGNPTPEPVMDPLGGMTDWRQFSWDDMAVLHVSNTTVDMITEFRQQDYAFWREYVSWIIRDYDLPIYYQDPDVMQNIPLLSSHMGDQLFPGDRF